MARRSMTKYNFCPRCKSKINDGCCSKCGWEE